MVSGAEIVVLRLRARQAEIEDAIFARVSGVASDPVSDGDAEYLVGLRATVAAGVDYVLSGIERGEGWGPVSIPREAAAQAHRAARGGVSLDTVLRRYMVGQALLWDYILEEAARVDWDPAHAEGGRVREMLRTQASLVDRLVTDVAREHVAELQRVRGTREHRLLERVKTLLAGEEEHAGHSNGAAGNRGLSNGFVSDGAMAHAGLDPELGYDLGAQHIGAIATGAGARELLRGVAQKLDRRLLSVACGQDTVWGWLGGRRPLRMADLRRAIPAGEVRIAVGEPAWGMHGWRSTHRQARAALTVALRRNGIPRNESPPAQGVILTCYRDVALLASALKDPALARVLIELYIAPLEDERGGGAVLRQTLRAYLDAGCNVSCATEQMQVARSTIRKRLRTIEARLGRTINPCPPELQVALALDELGSGADTNDPIFEATSGLDR